MKNLLLASTMLVASVTLANAQAVTISGEGRMGIQAVNTGVWSWTQEHRLRLDFNVAIQADHGLTFGAWTRAEMGSDWPGTAFGGVFSPVRVWVETNGMRLTFGNTDGAIASYGYSHGWLGGCNVGYEGGQLCGDTAGLANVIPSGLHFQTDDGSPHPAQIMASFEASNYAVAVSYQRGGSTEVAGNMSFGAFSVGAGYSNVGVDDIYTISGHYDGGAWSVGVIVAEVFDFTNWSVSGSASVYGGSLYGYVGRDFGSSTYGLSYGYDLGGGAVLTAGAEHWNFAGGITTASVGVTFTF